MENEYRLSYTAEQINEKLGKMDSAVLCTEQTLSEEQKTQARKNIGLDSTLTDIDLSGFENGSWTETIDGEVVTHTSVFSEDGTTVTIDGVVVKLG